MKNNEILALRTQIEREGLEKRRLEDAVMENMMQRLTMDKATQYSQKSLEKLRKSVQELVRECTCTCDTFNHKLNYYLLISN